MVEITSVSMHHNILSQGSNGIVQKVLIMVCCQITRVVELGNYVLEYKSCYYICVVTTHWSYLGSYENIVG
jgi:hypothetical protein